MYELYVIAAVVVGGTSLSGGRRKVCWNPNRSIYYCSNSERYEFNRRTELYTKSGAWFGFASGSFCRYAQEERLADLCIKVFTFFRSQDQVGLS